MQLYTCCCLLLCSPRVWVLVSTCFQLCIWLWWVSGKSHVEHIMLQVVHRGHVLFFKSSLLTSISWSCYIHTPVLLYHAISLCHALLQWTSMNASKTWSAFSTGFRCFLQGAAMFTTRQLMQRTDAMKRLAHHPRFDARTIERGSSWRFGKAPTLGSDIEFCFGRLLYEDYMFMKVRQ